jgi:heat shock protein HslJ
MAPILLTLMLALAQPGTYGAGGSEPFWSLEIVGGRMIYRVNDTVIAVRTPRRQQLRGGGYRYVTRRLIVEVRPERLYVDTVRVTANGYTASGCGGRLLPPETLTNTSWRIVAISGATVAGDNYSMNFDEGRMSAQAGCNRLSGPFRQSGQRLTAGPIVATRMACFGSRMTHERSVARLLAGPMRITYPNGETMVLTGSGMTVRLTRT